MGKSHVPKFFKIRCWKYTHALQSKSFQHVERSFSRFLIAVDNSKEVKWKNEWFNHKYWTKMENQRKALLDFAKDYGIKEPRDWGKVSYRDLASTEIGSMISRMYNGSPSKFIKSVLTEIHWEDEWFERRIQRYWVDKNNQREILEKLAKQLNIKKNSDWGRVTYKSFQENKCITLLQKFGGSIYKLLKHVYPGLKCYVRK